VRNNLGVLNGGVICMVAEEAALRAGAETFGAGAFVSQLSVSFISQVRQGPVRTEAEMLGLGLGGSVRTLVVDGGSGQVAALAMATVASTSRGASGR
jgi:acyl-coenzyme A thioesterase PaaI-like protein